jgi:hypothetical protein
MRCPHCEREIDESIFPPPLTYCPYCGQSLGASSAEGATEHVHFCPHCGKELPGTVNFCPYCGGEVARPAIPHYDRPEVSEPTQRGAKPIIEPPPEHSKKTAKLYKEWMKYSELPPEAAPLTEAPTETPAEWRVKLQRIPFLYKLIGLCVFALIVLIIIVLAQAC